MLAHVSALRRRSLHLLQLVNTWTAETASTPRSARAQQRLQTLRQQVIGIVRLSDNLLPLVPDSALEAAQQQPAFWLDVEHNLARTLQADPELHGLTMYLHSAGIDSPDLVKYARLEYMVPLRELL